jgi:hypothetical protein
MAKDFSPDFYVTCATVIPVLFLAVAVQGRPYQSVLGASLKAAQPMRGGPRMHRLAGRPMRRLGSYVASRFLDLIAFTILSAGVLGEFLALLALYRGSDNPGTRMTVLLATLVLVVAVVTGPLLGWSKLLDERRELRYQSREEATGEGEAGARARLDPGTPGAPGGDDDVAGGS